jgi:glyoxylase-like metal-dependent hydrolase (beta-lactamase superfamily II)
MIEIEPFNDDITAIKTATQGPDGSHPIMWAYSYKVLNTLFDAGAANAREEFREYFKDKTIDAVYISHLHEDHIGCADIFDGKVPIYAWKSAIDELHNPMELPEFFQWVWGQPLPVKEVTPMPETFDVESYHFKIIEIPGHQEDMVGFYEPDHKWFFSADGVPLPTRKYIAMPDENVPLMITSMERIQSLEIEILFDAHRGPIPSPREHIQKRIDYLKETQARVREMYKEGLDIPQMMEKLELSPPWYIEMTKDRFAVEFFIKSLIRDSP